MTEIVYHKKSFLLWVPIAALLLLAAIEYRVLNASLFLELFPRHHGVASWYSEGDVDINERTASGEIFDDTLDTCASWDHPLGSRVTITNNNTGKSVVCRVNDRGPRFWLGRVVDMTKSSFAKIGDLKLGTIEVTIDRL